MRTNNGLNREDWRRSNVDSIISALAIAIKEEKPACRFGISPFGVWRNIDKDSLGSATRAGQTNYDDLYADVLLWLKKGWIDYVAPQIYWEIGHKAAPYEVLVDWWSKHTYGRHCYIGLGIYRAGTNAAWRDSTLLPRQINLLRQYPQIQGAVYFSSKSFVSNPNGWSDSLRNNYYRLPALIPPMPWIDSLIPSDPVITKSFDGKDLHLDIEVKNSNSLVRSVNVYSIPAGEQTPVLIQTVPASGSNRLSIKLATSMNSRFALSYVNTSNNESKRVEVN